MSVIFATGCATRPDAITATHVSQSRYEDRTCKSLQRELDDVNDSLAASSGKLNDKANQDAAVVGVGTLLFWPVLFALGGNSGLEGDVGRLKGEQIALKKRIAELDCEAQPATPKAAPAPVIATPAIEASATPVPAQPVVSTEK
jgi:hypothetical protein